VAPAGAAEADLSPPLGTSSGGSARLEAPAGNFDRARPYRTVPIAQEECMSRLSPGLQVSLAYLKIASRIAWVLLQLAVLVVVVSGTVWLLYTRLGALGLALAWGAILLIYRFVQRDED
jgi:hypothetical protein